MAPPLLLLQDISLSLGSAPLLTGAELGVGAGERICLVGRNGSGKSTLLKVAAGLLAPDGGTRFLQPGATVRYLPQEPDFAGFATTLDYVESGMGPGDDHYRARALLDQLGLTGAEDPATLSGGQQRRCAIARTLAPSPDLLLLDEPTNHLDLPAIEWLEAELKSLRAGLVLISHDRRLLETLSRSIVWLEDGVTRRIDRGFGHYEAWREEVEQQAERDAHKLGRQIAREEDWLRYGVTARRKRNVRRLGELGALRQKRRELGGAASPLRLAATEADLSGKLVSVAERVSKAPVIRDLTLRVLRGDRLGIVGPNGAGKTTLLNLLTGRLAPDAGEIRVGTSLAEVTLDQQRASLDPAATLADTLTAGGGDTVVIGDERRHVIGYMKDFLFKPEQARTPVGVLSGGERGRLLLACAMARPSNLLVLDEPTNDLDLETLDLLQEMLADYPGTVLLVSHDRDFLDRVVTSTLAAEGDGRWVEYAGGYSDMLAQRGPLAAPAERSRTASAVPRPAARTPSRKLSFKDKHALETLPAQMEALQVQIARAQQTLAKPDLYRADPAGFRVANDALARAERDLATAEERWLELEMLREELEAS
ncbi:MAG: ATP-binding cassette domain-containing protein [Acetobacteraceae bacterium]